MEVLRSHVELIVPSTINGNEPVDTSLWKERVMSDFSRWFGGAFALDEEGCYLSSEQELVFEKVGHIRSYCTGDALQKHIAEVYALAKEIRAALSQECVSLIVNGKMCYVK